MCVVYGLNFLDKTSISYASIMGLVEDTNLKGDGGYLRLYFEQPTMLT